MPPSVMASTKMDARHSTLAPQALDSLVPPLRSARPRASKPSIMSGQAGVHVPWATLSLCPPAAPQLRGSYLQMLLRNNNGRSFTTIRTSGVPFCSHPVQEPPQCARPWRRDPVTGTTPPFVRDESQLDQRDPPTPTTAVSAHPPTPESRD